MNIYLYINMYKLKKNVHLVACHVLGNPLVVYLNQVTVFAWAYEELPQKKKQTNKYRKNKQINFIQITYASFDDVKPYDELESQVLLDLVDHSCEPLKHFDCPVVVEVHHVVIHRVVYYE